MEFSGTQTGLILLHNLESLDLIKEFKNLTTEEIKQESDLNLALESLLQEKLYQKQQSRTTWIEEGDENTKFY